MKINDVKVKENIMPEDIAEAIEFIARSCFSNGDFNPYYQGFAERMAVVKYFVDGIEFEENDSLYVATEIDDVKKVVARFFTEPKYSNEAKLMSTVKENVKEIVEYRKQRLIHGADAIEDIARRLNEFGNFISDLDVALGNLVKLDLDKVNKEDIESARELVKKLNSSGTEINAETITNVVRDAAKFDVDKASQEIIDAKNEEIKRLKEENEKLVKEHNARNVLSFKKEDDG